MKKYLKFKIFLIVLFLSLWQVFANFDSIPNSQKLQIEISYKKLSTQIIDTKTSIEAKNVLSKLDSNLIKLQKDKKYIKYKDYIFYIIYLNNLEIEKLNNIIISSKLKDNNDIFYFNKSILDKYNITKKFKNVVYNSESIFLENWIWYYYDYDKHFFIINEDILKISLSDLKSNNIDINNDLIAFDNKKKWLVFITEYDKIRLIDNSVIENINDKYGFLKVLKEDKINKNYDKDFVKMKLLSKSLTFWLQTKDEKIEAIYHYILDNISYIQNANWDSWIETYLDKTWQCSWYSKLFLYMLYFAWIEDISYMKWFVLNSSDFPDIWHAWVKIWNYYYDPTFDDPIWNEWNISFNDFKYYKLDYDLFYTNRYNLENFPEKYRFSSLTSRQKIVEDNLYNLALKNQDKYNDKILLKSSIFKIKNNLWNKTLEIEDLKKIIPYYEWSGRNTIIINWETKKTRSIRYYEINNSNIEQLLEQLKYNLNNSSLIKWDLWNWNIEYRFAYELTF